MASPLANVRYPAAPRGVPPRVVGLRVLQHTFKHDVAIVKYYLDRHTKNRYRNGSPVEIEWGYFPKGLELFVGHVHHTETKSENNRHYLYVVCIGTSYPMDEVVGVRSDTAITVRATGDATRPVVKGNHICEDGDEFLSSLASRTPDQVACALAAEQHMDIVLDTPDDQHEAPKTWASPGETRWAFMVRLAKANGFIFYVNKTTMNFYDPVKFLDKNKQTFPVLRLNIQRVAKQAPIESFKILHSDDGNVHVGHGVHAQDNRLHIIRGINPRTGAVISKTGKVPTRSLAGAILQPRFTRTHMDTPTHTAGEAQQRANALMRANRWRTYAKVRARGNARVHQGSGVVLQNVSKQDDGVWFVEAVEHDLHLTGTNATMVYMMDLTLARDSTSRRVPRPVLIAGRAVRPLETSSQRTGAWQTRPVYKAGKWRSAFRREVRL